MRGNLILDDVVGEPRIGVDGEFAARDDSPNRTSIVRFFIDLIVK